MLRVQVGVTTKSLEAVDGRAARDSGTNASRPPASCVESRTRTTNGSRFSRNARNRTLGCSPDLLTGARFPASSTYCGLPSSTCTHASISLVYTNSPCSKHLVDVERDDIQAPLLASHRRIVRQYFSALFISGWPGCTAAGFQSPQLFIFIYSFVSDTQVHRTVRDRQTDRNKRKKRIDMQAK